MKILTIPGMDAVEIALPDYPDTSEMAILGIRIYGNGHLVLHIENVKTREVVISETDFNSIAFEALKAHQGTT